MDVSYICEFVVLAEVQSFSAAAYQLHMSQSTLSRHIQTMEKELGHLLLTRTTRAVELTDYGQIYLPFARQIAKELINADAAFESYEKQRSQKTYIGVVHNPDLYRITECIIGFRRKYPEIALQIFEGSLSELRSEFSAGHLNIITMTYSDWEKPQHDFIPSGRSRLVAILPENHPLAACEKIPLRFLDNARLMVPNQATYTYQYLFHLLKQEGIHPDIVYHGSATGIADLLSEEMGILIQDQAIANLHKKSSLVIRTLEPDIAYTFGLEYQKKLSKNEKLFVKYIQTIMSESADI